MEKEGNCMEKNLQELYEELVKSDSLINEYKEAQKNGTVVEFAKAHGCNTTEEEIKAFIEEKTANGKEMSDEELDTVAGGKRNFVTYVTLQCNKCGATIEMNKNKWDYRHYNHDSECVCPNKCEGSELTIIKEVTKEG